jgi:hypothetical protein
MCAGICSREINSLPNGKLVKFDWGQNHIEAKFAQMRFAENVSVRDYSSRPDWGAENHLLKINLRGEKIRSWPDKCRYKTSTRFQRFEVGIVCSTQTYAAVDFRLLCLGIADVFYHSGYEPSSRPAIIGRWNINGAIVGDDPDLIRDNDGSVSHKFGITRNPPLIPSKTRRNQSDEDSDARIEEGRVFKPVFFGIGWLIGATTTFLGLWLCFFTVRRSAISAWIIGAILVLIGGACVIYSTFSLRLLAENVSTVPGIDASAARYSSTENVRVLPISVDHNAQMAFWAEPSLAQKGAVN